jgi:bifunctional DNase/RNase
MVPLRVKTVSHTPGAQTAVAVLETLTDHRTLALIVPLDEAHRLARVLGLSGCRCAPIYDLVDALVAALGTTIDRVVLDSCDRGIGAVVRLGDASEPLSCHPADALALALRAEAPIFATADVLSHTCPPGSHEHPPLSSSDATAPPSAEVTTWLDGLRPGDFGRGLDASA